MNNLYSQKTINANDLFDGFFLDNLTLYLYCFDLLPSLSFIDHLDGEKAYEGFKEKFKELIANVHQYRKYKRKGKQCGFDRTMQSTRKLLALKVI